MRLRVGDAVVLRTGDGPRMVIEEIADDGTVTVAWFEQRTDGSWGAMEVDFMSLDVLIKAPAVGSL